MPGPLPRRSHRVLLPVSSSMSSAFPKTLWVGFPFLSANATSHGLVFRGCRHFVMFRPLSLLVSQIAPTAASSPTGQPRLLPPGISCFVASARSGYAIRPIQAIDGKRTFTFQDLQPCRLLQCLSCVTAKDRGRSDMADSSRRPWRPAGRGGSAVEGKPRPGRGLLRARP
jgi:hypothetical protein